MRRRSRATALLWITLCIVLAAGCIPTAAGAQPDGQRYAFVDVSVITMDSDEVLHHQTVIVADGRIVAMGATARLEPPAGTVPIEGAGRFLMPGLIDAHIHLVSEHDLQLLLAYGVTTVRNMNGRPIHLQWRDQVAAGERLGPRIITASPMLGEVPRDLRVGSSADPVAARVAEYAASGYDFIKVGDALTAAELTEIVAAAAQYDLDVAGHAPDGIRYADLLAFGLRSGEHLDGLTGLTETQFAALLPEMAAAPLWIVPTLTIRQQLRPIQGEKSRAQLALADYLARTGRSSPCLAPQAFDEPHALTRPSGRYLELVAALHAAGVPLMLGTDAPFLCTTPGASVRQELHNLAEAGLSPYEALRTATSNPAEFLGMADEFGSIDVGKRADLLLLEENPIDDLAAVETIIGVMVDGRWLTAGDLEELRQ